MHVLFTRPIDDSKDLILKFKSLGHIVSSIPVISIKKKEYPKIKKAWNDHSIAIKKFGRYPHRNRILNRETTKEEELFLKQPNSSW